MHTLHDIFTYSTRSLNIIDLCTQKRNICASCPNSTLIGIWHHDIYIVINVVVYRLSTLISKSPNQTYGPKANID